jgi:hypothetical protein
VVAIAVPSRNRYRIGQQRFSATEVQLGVGSGYAAERGSASAKKVEITVSTVIGGMRGRAGDALVVCQRIA